MQFTGKFLLNKKKPYYLKTSTTGYNNASLTYKILNRTILHSMLCECTIFHHLARHCGQTVGQTNGQTDKWANR